MAWPRKRTQQRKLQRERSKVIEQLAHLASQSPGGSPENPRELASASLVEPIARQRRCILCEAETELLSHEALSVAALPLRVVTHRCRHCGDERRSYYYIVSDSLQ